MKNTVNTYPLYNKQMELIGTVELDNLHKGDYGPGDLIIYCHDTNGNIYEISAWSVERIINFTDPNFPRTYGRTL